MDPLGASLAGLFLLLFAAKTDGGQMLQVSFSPLQISLLALVGALVYLFVVLMLRRHYLGAMVENLRHEWLDFSRSETDVFTGLETREQRTLREQTAHEELDLEVAEAAIRALWLNNRPEAVEAILDVLTRAPEDEQARFCPLLAEMLETQDDGIIRQVMDWLEEGDVALGPHLIEALGCHSLVPPREWSHWLTSSVSQERAAGIVCLGRSWELESRLQALEGILKLLRDNEDERVMGIRALGYLQQERYAHYLMSYLGDASPAIRRETLLAVKLVGRTRLGTSIATSVARSRGR